MGKEGYLQKSKAYKGYHYSILKPEMLDYLHRRTLEMMRDILPIFEKNNIRYAICGGTLLGAATTGKFIPWDDDFDVCVFDEDYDKMVQLLIAESQNGGGKSWCLQCPETDSNYYLDWAKVRDKKSHVYPDIPTAKENGVWIDLYRLVPSKEKDTKWRIAKGHLDYVNRRYSLGGLTKKQYEERLKKGHLRRNYLLEKFKSYFNRSSKDAFIIWSASKVVVRKDWVLPLKGFDFEGLNLTSFGHAEEYLKQHYGESYNKWPDDELRRVGLNRIDYSE